MPDAVLNHVLIVEDEKVCQFLHTKFINKVFPQAVVSVASDGQEALDFLDAGAEGLELILLDLNMPGMNGLKFLEAYVKRPVADRVPVVILTSSMHPDDQEICLAYDDVKAYLVKPMGKDLVASLVEYL